MALLYPEEGSYYEDEYEEEEEEQEEEPEKNHEPPPVMTQFIESLLPSNTRFVQKSQDTDYFLIEVKPSIVSISFGPLFNHTGDGSPVSKGVNKLIASLVPRPEDRYDDNGDYVSYSHLRNFDVAFPWQYFYLGYKTVKSYYSKNIFLAKPYLYWAKERITSLDSPVFPAMLPNTPQHPRDTYDDDGHHTLGYVCLGYANQSEADESSIHNNADSTLATFYDSGFTQLLGPKSSIPYDSPFEWQEESAKNPLCWMDWDISNLEVRPLRTYLDQIHDLYHDDY